MTKRELIDRKHAVEVVSNGFDRWHMINLLASQESIPAITEQEIVKPYLEKLKSEVVKTIEWYKLRIPPTVYYELLSDIMNMEDEK